MFAVLLVMISSCQKEPSETTRPDANCQLARAYYFTETGILTDSLVYTNTNGKVTKASNADGHVIFDYNNDRITKRTFYDAGSQQPDAYDVITYNSDGNLKNIKKYYSFSNQTIPYEQDDFIYSGNRLVKFEVSYYDVVTSQYKLYETTTYTYTGDNIIQSITSYASGSSLDETFNYAYDANKNYLAKSHALFFDFIFMEEVTGEVIPLFMSSNNVVNILDDGDEFPLSYKPDDKENLSEWYFDGKLASRYLYNCK